MISNFLPYVTMCVFFVEGIELKTFGQVQPWLEFQKRELSVGACVKKSTSHSLW